MKRRNGIAEASGSGSKRNKECVIEEEMEDEEELVEEREEELEEEEDQEEEDLVEEQEEESMEGVVEEQEEEEDLEEEEDDLEQEEEDLEEEEEEAEELERLEEEVEQQQEEVEQREEEEVEEEVEKQEEERKIDRISNLLDSVLVHTLSFLPTIDAVKTVLLRRFGFLWATTDNLDFDVCSFHNSTEYVDDYEDFLDNADRFINFVNHVLILQECNAIHRFCLNVGLFMHGSFERPFSATSPACQRSFLTGHMSQTDVEKERRLANEVSTWTRFAMRRDVKILDLDFLACGDCGCGHEPDILYKIPDFLFSCHSLRELKLVGCKIEPHGRIFMGSLKSLFLKCVMIEHYSFDRLLSGCPILENLSLIECYRLKKLNFTSPNLKYLTVVVRTCDWVRLEISVPNIIALDISGLVQVVDLNNLSSLVDATLGFVKLSNRSDSVYHAVRKILENFKHAEVLRIHGEPILVGTVRELMKPSSNWKHLILTNTELTVWHLPGIASLLRASPCLETLNIHIDKDLRENGRHTNSFKFEQSSQCLKHLRTVRIYGYVKQSGVLHLVQFLLKSAKSLEKIVITSQRSKESSQKSCLTSDELLELSLKLLGFPRASTSAVVLCS